MRIKRYGFKLLKIIFALAVMTVIMINFETIFNALDCDALTISTSKTDVTDLPSKINFLDDDKNTFIRYCKNFYGEDLPIGIDNNIYQYYGNVNGYRFYRLQPTLVSYDNISQSEVIGGFTFESPYRFRPENTGLYIISDESVYTLEEAYKLGLIDIEKAYQLYKEKLKISKSSAATYHSRRFNYEPPFLFFWHCAIILPRIKD
jgi:hypothetical protein